MVSEMMRIEARFISESHIIQAMTDSGVRFQINGNGYELLENANFAESKIIERIEHYATIHS